MNVTKVPSRLGVYVKWLNQYGGWNYWLFNCIHKREIKDKNLKKIFNDFDDVSETTVPFFDIGKSSIETLTLISKRVSEDDQFVLNGIIDSPRVYLFTGTYLTQVTDVSWLGVSKKGSTNKITDYKKKTANYKLKIELPSRYNMTL